MRAVRARAGRLGRDGMPAWFDTALGAALAAFAVVDVLVVGLVPELAGHVGAAVCGAVAGAAVAMRRRRPLAAAVVVAGAVAVQAVVVAPGTGIAEIVAMLVVVFSAAVHAAPGRAVFALVECLAAIVTVSLLSADSVDGTLSVVPFTAVPFLAGVAVRAARAQVRRLEVLTRELSAERRRSAALAVADERRRIARDLHDVVAHGVGAMAMQAGGARRVLDIDLERAREALVAIESSGRSALDDLERMVGLLRDPSDIVHGAGSPTVADVGSLLAELRRGGLRVRYDAPTDAAAVAGIDVPVQVTAYRVIQEAVTNAMKHAPGAAVTVCVHRSGDVLEIVVVNGPAVRPDGPGGSAGGHGLTGMRERVTLFGGTVEAAADPGGGWTVRARLPASTS